MGKLSLDKLEEWAYQFANKFLEISEEPESVYLADMNGESVAIVLKDQYPGAKYITREIYGKMVWKKTDERTKFKVIKLCYCQYLFPTFDNIFSPPVFKKNLIIII
ncbi:hypothetical protein [Caldicellulosiruptor acetigenus]|uniref:Uncharacterized protein n=1 Tax=Caldicellulosiruptor acetigenus 6A TaxID=632516 RepID=G2PTA7_9FIRM|nr:hypothetical protein [Caldicellulosiruptor acetigenus]AEM74266.1 hypothetical protein Calla_1671 [Caldicellulosiruptor acetigenus 6A]